MKKLWINILLVLFAVSCGQTVKDEPKSDLFTELRKLNTVAEAQLSPKDKERHTSHKADLNQELQDFLKQQENITDFPSIEDRKQELASEIIGLNQQDESALEPQALEDLRQQRTSHINDLQALLEKGGLFQEIKNLNKVDEQNLSPEDKVTHNSYKSELNSRLTDLLGREENKSSNPEVENRKQGVLKELSNLNTEDESKLTPSELIALREQREALLNELLGLLDGSIVPEPEKLEELAPLEDTTSETQAQATTPPAEQVAAPVVEAPKEETTVAVEKEPRGELFEELLKLNTVEEAGLTPEVKVEHQTLKTDLNKELTETLGKEENRFSDPQEEQEKNDLQDELINLNNTDESSLNPEQLQQLRDRRQKIVERLQELLQNAQRYPAADYGITSKKAAGIDVKQEKDGNFDVVFTDLLFAFNKTDLRPAVRKTLAKIAKLLKENPSATATIGGHSDNIGPKWAKRKIANGRARNAKQYLINQGVEGERLSAQGYSDSKPLAKPFTSANRRKNRRVEVHIKMEKSVDSQDEQTEEGTENVDTTTDDAVLGTVDSVESNANTDSIGTGTEEISDVSTTDDSVVSSADNTTENSMETTIDTQADLAPTETPGLTNN